MTAFYTFEATRSDGLVVRTEASAHYTHFLAIWENERWDSIGGRLKGKWLDARPRLWGVCTTH